MTEREQFEATMCQLAEQPESSFEKPYDNDDVNAHWAVWQASRREALKDAHSAVRRCINVRDAEDAIRALPQKDPQ